MNRAFFKGIFLIIFSVGLSFVANANTFKDFSGEQKSVTDYIGQGQWVILMIWASDCHICNREAESYVEFHQAHKNNNAIVLGLSMDGAGRKDDALEFIKRNGVLYDNLIGEPQQVASFYSRNVGIPWAGTPTFMIYNPDGELLAQQVGAVPPELFDKFINSNSN